MARTLLARFIRAPFWHGFARSVDVAGALNRDVGRDRSADPWEADARALYGDWQAVGGDFYAVASRTPGLMVVYERPVRYAGSGRPSAGRTTARAREPERVDDRQ